MEELTDEDDTFLGVDSFQGHPTTMISFLENLPVANLTKGKSGDIKWETWANLREQTQALFSDMAKKEKSYVEVEKRQAQIIENLHEEAKKREIRHSKEKEDLRKEMLILSKNREQTSSIYIQGDMHEGAGSFRIKFPGDPFGILPSILPLVQLSSQV